MSLFFRKDRGKSMEGESPDRDDLDIIDLDQTEEWSKFEIEEEMLYDSSCDMAASVGTLVKEEELEQCAPEAIDIEGIEIQEISADTIDMEAIDGEAIDFEEINIEEMELEEAELDYLSMEEEEEEEVPAKKAGKRKKAEKSSFGMLDLAVACFGLLVCIVGVLTFVVYRGQNEKNKQVEAMANVGRKLETVGVLGKDQLIAVADARKVFLEETKLEEELNQVYEEKEETKEVQVLMKMTSVQKDLKIKFVNKKNGKLVGSIPFEVEIIDSGQKKYNKIDEDKDGIIYLTSLEPGEYSVSMVEKEGMEGYSYSTAKEKVRVKDKIAYEKIDVSDEIKDQSEVNVATEDTAKKEATEAVLQNTVEWVESRKEAISTEETYTQINKDTIADPALSASLGFDTGILRLRDQGIFMASLADPTEIGIQTEGAEEGSEEQKEEEDSVQDNQDNIEESDVIKSLSLKGSAASVSMGESLTITAQIEKEGEPSYTLLWEGADSDLISITQNGESLTVAVVKEPEQDTQITISAKASTRTASFTFTIKGKPNEPEVESPIPVSSIELNVSSLTLEVEQSYELKAAIKPDNAADKNYTWASSASEVVKVEGGKLTALKPGTAKITVTAAADPNVKAECQVTVNEKTQQEQVQIRLDQTQATLTVKNTLQLKVTVTPGDKTVKWSSSKPEVASVDQQGKVTAAAAGEAVITAEAEGKKAECKITVKSDYDPKADTSKTLKDKSGNQVYVKVDGKYVEAKAADYYKHSAFYKKETANGYRYFGWQNLDGRTYYFDKNGNKVTGDQVIQGAKYSFNSDGSLNTGSGVLGIDVSTWNGNINWSQVKNSGVSYVIIRTGFRGSTQGALVEDNKFRQNIKGALDAGLKVGVYFFTQAINEVEAVEEASMVLSQIKGYNITYPVFIDVEDSGGRADGLDAGTRTKVINAFCQTIQNGGYRAGIYANKTWFNQKMNLSALSGYKIWLAQYNTHVTYGGRYDMWQYSSTGTVAGISGKVDMNLSYMSY